MNRLVDLLVIGGGINGAGIARDAAGRGLSVTLVEKDDLAAHTSSASTKLVHGGLRYLEHYEFRLVSESLREREVLLRNAPHIIWPLRFVLPHEPEMRPKWMLRAGLALYDRLGGRRSLPGSHAVDLTRSPHSSILDQKLTHGFEYSDCWVEDSRLVVLTAMDARARGADILTRTECTALERRPDQWRATVRNREGVRRIEARAVVNAAGPWVDRIARMALGGGTQAHLRLVKGSHIVIPRVYGGDHAYIFQQPDGRIIFAIPYERRFTLIGTTDVRFEGDLDGVSIDGSERKYLRSAASRYFRKPVTEADIVHSYSGVRPLYEDDAASNAAVTRDYVLELDTAGGAPILSIYGGKITTYRKLAEHALKRLADVLAIPGDAWTATEPLPGGDIGAGFADFLYHQGQRYPWVPPEMLLRLARAYGTKLTEILAHHSGLSGLGRHFGETLYEAEVKYLIEQEFASTAQDVLWRRSKLGLHLDKASEQALIDWFEKRN